MKNTLAILFGLLYTNIMDVTEITNRRTNMTECKRCEGYGTINTITGLEKCPTCGGMGTADTTRPTDEYGVNLADPPEVTIPEPAHGMMVTMDPNIYKYHD